MQSDFPVAWPPAGVSIVSGGSGSSLGPANYHRILVHLSPATHTFCRESGRDFWRYEGDIDLIPRDKPGGFDALSPYESLEIRLAPGVIDRVAAELGHPTNAERFDVRHKLRDERIYHLARALEQERLANLPTGQLYLDSIGVALAARVLGLTEAEPFEKNRLSNTQLKRVIDYIDAHLECSLTIDILSREAGASSSHLRTWFKVATGLTLHRYVLRRRVERARNLLLQGGMSTTEIALAVGFSHQSHLARWMRREMGVTPKTVRRSADET